MLITEQLRAFQLDQSLYEGVVSEITRHCPRGGVHLDCGAHLGLHTRPMLARADVRRVYAFEAIPSLCERLEMNFASDLRFRLVRGAIGNTNSETKFSVALDAPGYSGLKERDLAAVRRWQTGLLPVSRTPC